MGAMEYAVSRGVVLNNDALDELASIPRKESRAIIQELSVRNPSKYLMIGAQKMQSGLGVEQGVAMEYAVSLGVVLNNDALDELASIPRKESRAIIQELSVNAAAREDL